MKDHKSPFSSTAGKRQKITRRETGGANLEERRWFWRTTVLGLGVALAVGVVGSLGFGYRINSDLEELVIQREKLEQTTALNRRLQQEQEQLLSENRLQEAVRKRGLKPPNAAQMKKL
jgi:hypothetical protein